MTTLLLLGPALSLALLSAHFYRDGIWPLALVCVALVALLAWRRAWVPALLQFALGAGCVEWAWTTIVLLQQRMALGRPWGRLALILGAVMLFTAVSALALRHARVRRHYRSVRSRDDGVDTRANRGDPPPAASGHAGTQRGSTTGDG